MSKKFLMLVNMAKGSVSLSFDHNRDYRRHQ